jgi:hypothetical protein
MTDKNLCLCRRAICTLLLLVASPIGRAQSRALAQEAAAPPPHGFSPSQAIGLFAYPKKEQSADQQVKDESACYSSAREKTGVDPQAPPPAAKTAEQKAAEQKAAADSAPKAKSGRVRGAARGAAGGAAIGAIADDEAGKGAGADQKVTVRVHQPKQAILDGRYQIPPVTKVATEAFDRDVS